MNLQQYQSFCRTLEPDYDRILPTTGHTNGHKFGRQFWRLQHAVEGLITELGELSDASDSTNLLEELGDLTWYCAIGLDAAGFMHSIWVDTDSPGYKGEEFQRALVRNIISGEPNGKLRGMADMMKRWKFYGVIEDNWQSLFQVRFDSVLYIVAGIAQANGHTMQDVLNANQRKLEKVRYKKGFTKEAALVRDHDAEKKALEGN